MNFYLYAAAGIVAGGFGRYGMTRVASRASDQAFPWSTTLINIVGSFILGFLSVEVLPAGALAASVAPRMSFMVGVCVGFAAVAFSLQTLDLLRTGDSARLATNVLSSVMLCITVMILCVVAVILGHALALYAGTPGATAFET